MLPVQPLPPSVLLPSAILTVHAFATPASPASIALHSLSSLFYCHMQSWLQSTYLLLSGTILTHPTTFLLPGAISTKPTLLSGTLIPYLARCKSTTSSSKQVFYSCQAQTQPCALCMLASLTLAIAFLLQPPHSLTYCLLQFCPLSCLYPSVFSTSTFVAATYVPNNPGGCITTSRDTLKLCDTKLTKFVGSLPYNNRGNLIVSTNFAGFIFVMARNRIQPLLLPIIIALPDGSMSVTGTTSNIPTTPTVAWVDCAILGNLIVVMPNALDCGSFIAEKKFEADEIPEIQTLLPTNDSDDPTFKLVKIPA